MEKQDLNLASEFMLLAIMLIAQDVPPSSGRTFVDFT